MAYPPLGKSPSVEVPAPAVRPHRYGLLSVAEVIDMPASSSLWQFGARYMSNGLCGSAGHVWAAPCNSLGEPHNPPVPVTVKIEYSYGPATAAGSAKLYPVLAKVTVTPAPGKDGYPQELAVDAMFAGSGWGPVPTDGTAVPIGTTNDGRTFPITVKARIAGAGIPNLGDKEAALPAPDKGTVSITFDFDYTDTSGGTKIREGGPAWVDADVFTVYATAACQPGAGFKDVAKKIAAGNLAQGEGVAIEQRLWQTWAELAGQQAEMDVPLNDTVMDGLRKLETAAALCLGGEPVLHMPRMTAWCLKCVQALDKVDDHYETPLGAAAVFGLGYSDRRGPIGVPVPAGQMPVYATGPVVIRRSPVIEHEYLDQSTNEYMAVAERVYAVTWDCCFKAGVISQCGGCDCPTS